MIKGWGRVYDWLNPPDFACKNGGKYSRIFPLAHWRREEKTGIQRRGQGLAFYDVRTREQEKRKKKMEY